MSQSSPESTAVEQPFTPDEVEVREALLDHSDEHNAWIFEQLDAAERRAAERW